MATRKPGLDCLCGSGKKYKTCCMTMDMKRQKRSDESNKVTSDLVVFMLDPRFAPDLEAARMVFPGNAGEHGEIRHYAFLEWAAYDYVLKGSGKTILELFAERAKTPIEKEITASLLGASLSIHEIVSVKRGLCITVRDVFDGSETVVYDKSMSMMARPEYAIVTRLHEVGGMTLACRVNTPLLDYEQTKKLKDFVEQEARRTGCGSIKECLRKNAHTIMIFGDELNQSDYPNTAAVDEGQNTINTVLYQLNQSQKQVTSMLRRARGMMYVGRHQGIEGIMMIDHTPQGSDDSNYFMIRDGGPAGIFDPHNDEIPGKARRVMGIILVKSHEMNMLCKSDPMTEKARGRLEDMLGDAAVFVSISMRDDDAFYA